jgi:hypothetical protein
MKHNNLKTMENIFKLSYTNKEAALADLTAKGIYVETEDGLTYGEGVAAVVEIGLIILEQGTYDEEGNVITEPIYADGYHYDVMAPSFTTSGLTL